jgi:hypothetical protein
MFETLEDSIRQQAWASRKRCTIGGCALKSVCWAYSDAVASSGRRSESIKVRLSFWSKLEPFIQFYLFDQVHFVHVQV